LAAGEASGVVDRFEAAFALAFAAGVPDGRVPMGATAGAGWLGFDAPSRFGDPPREDDESKAPLFPLGFDWGLAVLLGREPCSWFGPVGGAESGADPGAPPSEGPWG
jgi:hypothetical protein